MRRRWTTGTAWGLWAVALLALAAVPWLDRLLREAGRADLVQLTPGTVGPVLAMVSGATAGAVLASRRPRHPVGWLLLGVALALTATAAAAQYLTWGLLVHPGALPGARAVARYFPAIGFTAMTLIGFLLLLTPTGSLPSPRWRWWARAMAAVPAVLVLVVTFADGPLDPRYQALGGPFDLRGLGGALLVANQVALALTTLAVMVAAGSLVGRFRRASGLERLQLRWVALAALVVALAGVAVLAALAVGVPGGTALVSWAVGVCVAILPLATGAAILRYRLYDLDRIISRTLAVAAVFQPARRRIQQGVDRRFNRRRHDAARTIEAFGVRLRDQVDLDGLRGELLGVVEDTMQPTRVSLWLRQPQAPVSS
jgi:hypothetical protein